MLACESVSGARGGSGALRGGALVVALSGTALADSPHPAAAQAVRFASEMRGLSAEAGIGTSSVGDSLLFALGGEWQGIRSLQAQHWLLQWNVSLAVRGGYLANQKPYLFLVGVRMDSFAEAGYRFVSTEELTPYAGLRLANEQQVLLHPGRALSDHAQFNAVDGVGGVVMHAAVRADGGVSWLTPGRALLLVGFLQESFEDLQVNTEALTLTQLGLAARYDQRSGLSAGLEGAWGISPERSSSLLALRDQTSRVSLAANFRWLFPQRNWLGAAASLARDSDHLEYPGGRNYDTRSAPVLGISVVYGFSLERTPP